MIPNQRSCDYLLKFCSLKVQACLQISTTDSVIISCSLWMPCFYYWILVHSGAADLVVLVGIVDGRILSMSSMLINFVPRDAISAWDYSLAQEDCYCDSFWHVSTEFSVTKIFNVMISSWSIALTIVQVPERAQHHGGCHRSQMHHVASWLRFLSRECHLRGYLQRPRSQLHRPERKYLQHFFV